MPTLLERALIATRASRRIELKPTLDLDEKDIAAMANSGGGVILFGVDRRGEAIGVRRDSAALKAAALPPHSEIVETVKFGKPVVAVIIAEAPTPIVCDGIVYIRRVVREPEAPLAVRVVADRRAPAYRVVDYDKTHPYRQKELLAFLDWLVAQARRDPNFFADARQKYRSGMLSRA
jgi:hypothetical protein